MSNGTAKVRMGTQQSGWVTFAGVLMIVAGFFHAITGLVAILKPELYVATENHLFAFDYTQWGWVHLIFGAILIFSAASLYGGRLWGRVVAITMATVSAVINFGFIWAYPLWSIMIIVMDMVIIYSVAMYGGRDEALNA
jgi:hypothetical protein